jgi:hypothetical protein
MANSIVSVILIPMHPRETISQFDQFLASRGLRFEATVIGGTALGLLGVSSSRDVSAVLDDLETRLGDGL